MNQTKAMQHLIIAGNALCAALDKDVPISDEDYDRIMTAWDVAVASAQKSVPRPRPLLGKSGYVQGGQ